MQDARRYFDDVPLKSPERLPDRSYVIAGSLRRPAVSLSPSLRHLPSHPDDWLSTLSRRLLEPLLENLSANDRLLITRAFMLASIAHCGQTRETGAPYVTHPAAVARLLKEADFPPAVIAAGLLHDLAEDTVFGISDIARLVDPDIATIVDGVTRLTRTSLLTSDERYLDDTRSFLLAISRDLRVVAVKLADRLHNMRTIDYVASFSKREKKARETLSIHAPLAERLGLAAWAEELKQRCFQLLNPVENEAICRQIDDLTHDGRSHFTAICSELADRLEELSVHRGHHTNALHAREKSPASIHDKMMRQRIGLSTIADIYAVRLIVSNVEDCYAVLGYLHQIAQAVPGRFRDFISTPKPNGYRSLHTTLLLRDGMRLEVQIRTSEMHAIAERGLAAHWSYKANNGGTAKDARRDGNSLAVDAPADSSDQHKGPKGLSPTPTSPARITPPPSERSAGDLLNVLGRRSSSSASRIIDSIQSSLEDTDSMDGFLSAVRSDFGVQDIFVFDREGHVHAVADGATDLDLAYHLRADLGHRFAYAFINGHRVTPGTRLTNGDRVLIKTAGEDRVSSAWLSLVSTRHAHALIARWLRRRKAQDDLRMGRRTLETALQDLSLSISDDALLRVAREAGLGNLSELYRALGDGTRRVDDVILSAFPHLGDEEDARKRLMRVALSQPTLSEPQPARLVGLPDGSAHHFAECCLPVRGDLIIGIAASGEDPGSAEIAVHRHDCPLAQKNSSPYALSWLSSSGTGAEAIVQRTRLRVMLTNAPGSLAAVTATIARAHANITHLATVGRTEGHFVHVFEVQVLDQAHIDDLIRSLNSLPVVVEAFRVDDAGYYRFKSGGH